MGGGSEAVAVPGKAPIPNGWLLDGCAAEHHVRKVVLGDNGNTDMTGRVRTQGEGNVLQGGGPGNINV